MGGITAYILPSEPHTPPRAVVVEFEGDEPPELEGLEGLLAQWSPDTGCWFIGEQPVLPPINEMLVNHARSLGINL